MNANNLILHRPKYQDSPHLQLLRPLADGRQELLWHRDMPAGGRELVLAAFYDDSHFVAAEESGRIYQGNLAGELTLVAELPVKGIWGGAWLDLARQRFWYAAELDLDGSDSCCLRGWSLADWQVIADITLPDYTPTQTLTGRSDGALLFYRHRANKEHGFYCVDPVSGQCRYQPLASKAMPDLMYPMNKIDLCPVRDLALLPAVDQLPIEGRWSRVSLGFQVQLVDLNSFEVRWHQTLRQFPLAELDDGDDLLALAKGKDRDAEDALEYFVEKLNGLRFCPGEDAFWVHWADGRLQKASLDPALGTLARYRLVEQAEALAGRPHPLAAFGFKNYDYPLLEMNGCLPFIDFKGVGVAVLDSPLAEPQDGWLPIPRSPCAAPEQLASKAGLASLAQSAKVIIDLDYLVLAECRLAAAEQLRDLARDLGSHIKGRRLELRFCDKDDRQRNEAEFVQMAIADPGVAEVLAEAVDLFSGHPEAPFVRSGDSKAALSDTVLALAGLGSRYLPVIARYLNAIDAEHCAQFHVEHTLVLLHQQHQEGALPGAAYHDFIRALPWPFNGEE
ncbi:hypothetical protein [Gallaecimonas xiamenensis]|uniref:Uncharacterized protein n=1 Tax=Gallaecimonas xiamenensis 3-C-1 TaxID=745411 RepID=K2JSB8_9GAMM|nr:hypothetical protein [Gallaecimonas xiamenensis]EKE68035.1 hypothetical protein B3C1_17547 [Gallaecimonas xiamenensis 3-C-1]